MPNVDFSNLAQTAVSEDPTRDMKTVDASSIIAKVDEVPRRDPTFRSFLNNGVDELTPAPKKDSSSISLSDQWAGSIHSMTKLTDLNDNGGSTTLQKSHSALSNFSLTSADGKRCKKAIIDHPRVASYAFAFDIDGVILNGPQTIPYAREAVRMLNGNNKYHILVPYIFVTNGGGRPEAARAQDLSKRLGTHISTDQIIQGHTPMKGLAGTYENVLVVGGVSDTCRGIAEGYGFKNVYIPLDIMYWNPSVSPYYQLSEEDKKVCKKNLDFSKIKIDAILVFADSRNWAADQQIILELLMSDGGYMGTVSKTYTGGPGIYFAHSDFIWSTDYKLSRYGMGALQVSIAALYKETTGSDLKVTRFGKPQRGTFRYAEKILSKWREDVLEEYVEVLAEENEEKNAGSVMDDEEELTRKVIRGVHKASENVHQLFDDSESDEEEDDDDDNNSYEGLTFQNLSIHKHQIPRASTVYFVGDTPDSDILFSNAHDESWFSILVKTGVYKEGTVPKYKPKKICDNVLEAVKFAITREATMELEEWNSESAD
ncbi:hypothetical protein FOA43_001300 [Brettanomyces nanus]|uniref:Phosphatidyl synthase n=1 Tax=Eeniella nana TaxID=13502 RepID=A0A875S3X5_EENNA|nr:uncharacterized protein FOA43_001300 [Brettanomyces nanus]QPG73984.1 hypothetical protein FOA43_001300 [Brettanomyces nanus]